MRKKVDFVPKVALVLGSGLGDYGDSIQIEQVLDYHDIDGFPVSTVQGHKGRFLFGYVEKDVYKRQHQGKETPAVEVTDQIFDTLLVVNPETNELEPQIAESWEQTSDTSYTFKIRQGIKFHDGSELTAEDVKFSLERAINSAAVSYVIDFVDSVEVVDPYTCLFYTSLLLLQPEFLFPDEGP